jgi:hypothetical protein
LVVYYSGLDGFGPHQRWLSCSYGNDSLLRLYKKMPFDIKQCVIRYSETYGSPGFYDLESYRCDRLADTAASATWVIDEHSKNEKGRRLASARSASMYFDVDIHTFRSSLKPF